MLARLRRVTPACVAALCAACASVSSEAPQAEAPQAEAPSAEAPSAETRASELPVSEAPAAGASSTGAPPPEAPADGPDGGGSLLPAGDGRAILERACTGCHNLEGLWAYQGYYDAARWRGLVDTMIAHGADVNETEAARLVDYLTEHFGPGTR